MVSELGDIFPTDNAGVTGLYYNKYLIEMGSKVVPIGISRSSGFQKAQN